MRKIGRMRLWVSGLPSPAWAESRDDRRFLEALHFFTVESVRWRALPERFGPWNSVWKRFDRLSKAGVFEAFFDALAAMSSSAHLIQMFDSTIGRAPGSAAGPRGARRPGARALARWIHTTKIHAKSDASGDIIAFDLTGGEASDARHFDVPLDIGPDIQPRAVICDKGYASKANREAARERGVAPVIPHKANERDKPAFFARTLYKARSRIEQGVGRLKRVKWVALRCEKTARNFRSIVSFAAGLCLIKFVHTA
jgi:transposase